ncbi:MAG: hypothetical protein ACLU0O_08635 [Collinsella sp.]
MTRVVEEVAEEHGANTAVALAKVKAAVAEKVEDDEELPLGISSMRSLRTSRLSRRACARH